MYGRFFFHRKFIIDARCVHRASSSIQPHFYGRSTDRHTRKQWIKCQNPNATVNWTHIHSHRLHTRSTYMCVSALRIEKSGARQLTQIQPQDTHTHNWNRAPYAHMCERDENIVWQLRIFAVRCGFVLLFGQIFRGIQAFSDLLWIVKSDDSIQFRVGSFHLWQFLRLTPWHLNKVSFSFA